MTSLVRFVLVSVLALLLVVLAFMMIGCFPVQATAGGGIFRSDYRVLMNESFPDTLLVPVAGVKRRELRDSWGAPRDDGERSHEGIDIMAKRNSPVLSATRGVIVRRGETERGGEVVWVMGPGGLTHYYAHLDSFGRYEEGTWVQAGDTLGYVGNSGNARGGPTHLHYGIYTDTGAVNPYPLLAAASSATPTTTLRRGR